VGGEGSAGGGVMRRGSGSYLELWQYHDHARLGGEPAESGAHELGRRHVASEVDDVDAALSRLVDLGGLRTGDPMQMPGGGAAVYCRDPFVTIIELMSCGSALASLDDL